MIGHNDEAAIQLHAQQCALGKPLLASWDRKTRTGQLHKCEVKRPHDEYMVAKAVRDVDEAGYSGVRMVMKTDQGHAMVKFAEHVVARRSGETVPQVSPQGDPASNGDIESWIGRVKGHLRTLKLAIEANLISPPVRKKRWPS